MAQEMTDAQILKVGSKSDPVKVGGAIAGTVREQGKATVQTIGAGALSQAVKSVAVARFYLVKQGIDLISYPIFVDVEVDGEIKTAIRLIVEPRHPPKAWVPIPKPPE